MTQRQSGGFGGSAGGFGGGSGKPLQLQRKPPPGLLVGTNKTLCLGFVVLFVAL